MMDRIFDRATLMIMASALAVAATCILPETRGIFPFWLIAAGMHVADTLFHELGHTIFSWLFGCPAIPMIFTLFGANQAGGLSLAYDRNWLIQIGAFAALIYGCWWLRQYYERFFLPAVIFSLFITACAFTRYWQVVILYMGHGGSIAMGTFFLVRAWLNTGARNGFERWLNAFFGFFLVLYNMYFAYTLAFDTLKRGEYTDHAAFGIAHNDFLAITEDIYNWSVRGIGLFTIGLCLTAIAASLAIAIWIRKND